MNRQHIGTTLWLSRLSLYEAVLLMEADGPGKHREELPKVKSLTQMLVPGLREEMVDSQD